MEQLRGTLRAPGWVAEVVARDPTLAKAHITVAMFRLGQMLDQLSPVEQPHIARLLVETMIVSSRDTCQRY